MRILKGILKFILSLLETALLLLKIVTPLTKLIGYFFIFNYIWLYARHIENFLELDLQTKIDYISYVVVPLFLGNFIDFLVFIIRKIRSLL